MAHKVAPHSELAASVDPDGVWQIEVAASLVERIYHLDCAADRQTRITEHTRLKV
ncbi:MAG: hypothetical protein J0H17_20065 [Rhizobiales bacterium]|nr:hypothetical protein [Hyphomicrobiales bacterium]